MTEIKGQGGGKILLKKKKKNNNSFMKQKVTFRCFIAASFLLLGSSLIQPVAPLVTEIKGQGGVKILLKEKGTNSFVIKKLTFRCFIGSSFSARHY